MTTPSTAAPQAASPLLSSSGVAALFSGLKSDVLAAAGSLEQDAEAEIDKLFGAAQTKVATTITTVAPTLDSDLAALDTAVETGLTAFTTAHLGPVAGAAEASVADPVIQELTADAIPLLEAAASQAIATANNWLAAMKAKIPAL